MTKLESLGVWEDDHGTAFFEVKAAIAAATIDNREAYPRGWEDALTAFGNGAMAALMNTMTTHERAHVTLLGKFREAIDVEIRNRLERLEAMKNG
jgi:hypothetical protein